jgi:hypothetical protein
MAKAEPFVGRDGFESAVLSTVRVDLRAESEGADSIAAETGGFVVKNTNDLGSGINRVSSESRTYYLLGFNPRQVRRDGKFRKIEVKLTDPRRKGLAVRARRGYYAPSDTDAVRPPASPSAASAAPPEILQALDSPFTRADVPLRVSAFSFDEAMFDRLNVTVAAEVDVRELVFKEEEGRLKDSVAVVIEAQHRETGEYYRYDQFQLPPGGYQVKVVVRDLGSGRVGSVVHEFEVPAAGSFRVSTPVLSDTLDSGEGGAKRPVLQVRRGFSRDALLYCQFAVYGAAREEKGSLAPHVRAGYEVRRADGTLFKRSAPTLINPTSVGALLRLNGISLKGAAPGEYELVLTVQDELAGKSVEIREPFEIEAG